MASTTAVRIIRCTNPTELYRHYDGQSAPQPVYIELDLREGTLLADYNAEVGNLLPDAVRDGFERRYRIPILTAEAANRTMEELLPLAERILADWEQEWDGNNHRAVLGLEAREAEAAIEKKLGLNLSHGDLDADTQGFDPKDLLDLWGLDSATNGSEAEDYGITAGTTDERLGEIAADILSNLAECGTEGSTPVCHGLAGYLRQLRDDAASED
ncbi:hypothetical protein [Streptomyces triculaminicus]|uniref:hypothetical protein n=1 Tax=Streptomyces triculaminicus TaxID=2816232 RepID=UPI0037A834A2